MSQAQLERLHAGSVKLASIDTPSSMRSLSTCLVSDELSSELVTGPRA